MKEDYNCIDFNKLMKSCKHLYCNGYFFLEDQRLPTVLLKEDEVLATWLEQAPPIVYRYASNSRHQIIVFDESIENWVIVFWGEFRRIVQSMLLRVINSHREIRGMEPRGWDTDNAFSALRRNRYQRNNRSSNAVTLHWRRDNLLESKELHLAGIKRYTPTRSLFIPARAKRLGQSYTEKQLAGLLERRYNW